jgi:hypothetical protein
VVCDVTRDRRQPSITPLQALTMYNGRFASEEARHFATRVRKEAGESVKDQITLGFRIALGREPSPDELERMQPIAAANEGLEGLCRVLLNTNEFIHAE